MIEFIRIIFYHTCYTDLY